MLSYLATSFDVVFVLFCYSSIESGGLAFSVSFTPPQNMCRCGQLTTEQASQIGYSLATSGVIAALIQLCIMSYLLRTFDPAKMYNFCMSLWPYTFLFLPFLNLIARAGLDETTGELGANTVALLWVGIAFILLLCKVAGLSYSYVVHLSAYA
jgi:hypothetical protein